MVSNIFQNKFFKNVVLIASGTAGAQIINVIFSPLITRLYGPEAFGLLGTYVATLMIAMPIAALTYPIAMVLPKNDADSRGIAKLSLFIGFGLSVLISIIILISGDSLANLLNLENIANYLLLIPLAMFLNALQQIIEQWFIRKKLFKVTARVAISQSLLLNGAKVLVGFLNPIGAALIFLSVLGNALYVLQLWLGEKKWAAANDQLLKKTIDNVNLKCVALQYKDFPLYRAPQVFLNAASRSLPVLLLASFFGPASAGFYALSQTVLAFPAALLGKAVSDVFFSRIVELKNSDGDIFSLIFKATFILSLIGVFPFGVIFLFGPDIFKIFFGEQWGLAGEYSRWMAIWVFFGFINRPSISAISVLNMQGFFLSYEIFSVLLRVGALWVGLWIYKSDLFAVALFSIVGAVLNFIIIISTLYKSKK